MKIQHNFDVYSSVLIGPNAYGTVRLFITPQGQAIPRLGEIASRRFSAHTPFTTNIMKAGELGVSIGYMAVRTLRVDFVGALFDDLGEFFESATYVFRVSGNREAEGPVRDLPKLFPPDDPILIAPHDVVEAQIEIPAPIATKSGFLLRMVMTGDLSNDVR
jgi:hypothetical protein